MNLPDLITEMAYQGVATHSASQLVRWLRIVQADRGRWAELAVLLCLREAPPGDFRMRLDVVNMLRSLAHEVMDEDHGADRKNWTARWSIAARLFDLRDDLRELDDSKLDRFLETWLGSRSVAP